MLIYFLSFFRIDVCHVKKCMFDVLQQVYSRLVLEIYNLNQSVNTWPWQKWEGIDSCSRSSRMELEAIDLAKSAPTASLHWWTAAVLSCQSVLVLFSACGETTNVRVWSTVSSVLYLELRCGFRVGSRWASLTIILVHNCMRGDVGSGPLPVPDPTISSCAAVNTQAIDWFFISDLRVSICLCYFCVHVCPRPSNGKGLLEFVAVILKESSLVTAGNERDHSANQAFITMAGTQLSSQSEIINRHVLSQVPAETLHGVRDGGRRERWEKGRSDTQTASFETTV